jgi:hypothetical protein
MIAELLVASVKTTEINQALPLVGHYSGQTTLDSEWHRKPQVAEVWNS